MGRRGAGRAWPALLFLALVACSDAGTGPPAAEGSATGASVAPSSAAAPAAEPVRSRGAGAVPAASAGSTPDGWRLTVRSPRAGTQTSAPFVLAYEVRGSSHAAALVLEVTLVDPPGEGPDAAPRRYRVAPGSGEVLVDVGKLSTGRHDLQVRLLAAGAQAAVVVVEDVRIAGDRSAGG